MTEKTRDIQSLLDDLGQAVKAARVDRGLTQADVVKACGLSQNIVTNLEKGKGTAVASLLAILEHLDLADDIIKAILPKEVPTKRDVRYRAPAEKEPESSDSLKLEPLELYRDEDEIITMTRTLKRDELNQALSEDPMGVYRISHAVVGELMRDLQANIAVHIRTCKFRLAGGGVRQKEATSLPRLPRPRHLTWYGQSVAT
ncbi:hypothetical protein JCM19235_1296 [Vibrio maritimus]|uniref:HTH cro/C1-type domain-containing protein n=1 Tax=Vibrio maritimus TaxID=990268 RepID=A0A090S5N3_9VIBR|nr:hypothetical protein JCM19235_1296 [Vibrio maritimus]